MKIQLIAAIALCNFAVAGCAQTTTQNAQGSTVEFDRTRAAQQNIVFPDDANIINVKAAPYLAKGDGVTDDTEAVRKAFNSTGLIYFPNGTYLVSAGFEPPRRKGKVPSRRVLQGQSTAGTVIKIKDNTAAFGDTSKPLGLFKMSYAPEQAFRNGVRNLTIDTGKGNPGAIGMQFYASNQGGMHHVVIRSGDGQGRIGLDLNFSGNNGPLLVKDIRVSGFDVGIDGGSGHLNTFEHVLVENQNKIGFYAQSYAFVRGFESKQKHPIPAVLTKGHSLVTLIDATCEGEGAAAVVAGGESVLVRNLRTVGYDAAIRRGENITKGPRVAEWTAQPVNTLFPSPPRSLGLPIKETPEVPWDDPKTWANVLKFGPPRDNTKKKRDAFDITENFQKAIDSGATTIYFPRLTNTDGDKDKYHLSGTVFVRGNVRRIIGMENEFREPVGAIESKNEAAHDASLGKDIPGRIVVEKGAAPVVVIERFDSIYGDFSIENRSPRTLVVSSGFAQSISLLPGAGDLFVEDLCFAYLDINGQNVWMRQANMEASYLSTVDKPRPNVRQNGGTLWVHGLKTEQNRTKLWVKNGAAEYSAFILANRGSNPLPMFEAIDSRLSVSIAEDVLRKSPFAVAVRETRGTQTRDLKHEDAPRFGQGKMISLFVADAGSGTAPPAAPQNFSAKPISPRKVLLSWRAAAEGAKADGFAIERRQDNAWKQIVLARADQNETEIEGLIAQTDYAFRVVAFNGKGGAPSVEAKTTTLAPPAGSGGTGLRAEYYASKYFGELKQTKTDAGINFDWSQSAPENLKIGDFAVRWTGLLEPRFSEETTFSIPTEGTRVWINNTLLFDGKGKTRKANVVLEAGKRVPIKVEFMAKRDYKAILNWQSESQPLETVPASQLFPATESLPTISLVSSKTKATEGETVSVRIRRDAGPDIALAPEYTIGGDAVADGDYTKLMGKAALAANEKQTEWVVAVLDDKTGEPEKNLTLTLKTGATFNVNGPPVSLSLRDNDLPPAGNGTGLKAEFFADQKFANFKSKRIDGDVDFNWDKGAPAKGLDPKAYSIRWTGQIQPLFSEEYTFSIPSTIYGSARLSIDNNLVAVGNGKGGTRKGTIKLEAGKKYDLKLEYVNDRFYGAKISLNWQSASQFQQAVPKSQLYPAP